MTLSLMRFLESRKSSNLRDEGWKIWISPEEPPCPLSPEEGSSVHDIITLKETWWGGGLPVQLCCSTWRSASASAIASAELKLVLVLEQVLVWVKPRQGRGITLLWAHYWSPPAPSYVFTTIATYLAGYSEPPFPFSRNMVQNLNFRS